jgi:hypothetical protein
MPKNGGRDHVRPPFLGVLSDAAIAAGGYNRPSAWGA